MFSLSLFNLILHIFILFLFFLALWFKLYEDFSSTTGNELILVLNLLSLLSFVCFAHWHKVVTNFLLDFYSFGPYPSVGNGSGKSALTQSVVQGSIILLQLYHSLLPRFFFLTTSLNDKNNTYDNPTDNIYYFFFIQINRLIRLLIVDSYQ